MATHPTKDELSGFLLGKLAPQATEAVAEHLDQCPPCQDTIQALESHQDTLLQSLRQPAPPSVKADADVEGVVENIAKLIEQKDADATHVSASSAQPTEPSLVSIPSQTQVAIPRREQFLNALLASGLVNAAEWMRLQAEVPAIASAADGAALARALMQHGTLTKFQASVLYQGKSKGLVFGEYAVLDRLGEGGMGQVFKAQHRSMDRIVALKILAKTAMTSPEAIKRFQREVKAAAKLFHPNIVTAFDAGQQEGIHFLVMEYVGGSDLSALLKEQGRLSIEKAIAYVLQTARGLAFAHSKGVVHRDIKPANLLLDGDVVKILDMGLARIDGGALQAAQEGLTQTGQVMGTADYMAPEQAFDIRHADARADMYSLGCTLYRLLTGQNLYTGETLVQKILAHRENPIPSLHDALPDIPPKVDALYQRMVAKDPQERPTMADAVAELEAIQRSLTSSPETHTLGGSTAPTSAVPQFVIEAQPSVLRSSPSKPAVERRDPPWRSRRTLIAAGAAGFVLLLLGVWVIVRDKSGNEVARFHVDDDKTVEIVPDGRGTKKTEKVPAGRAGSESSGGPYGLRFVGTGSYVDVPLELKGDETTLTIEAWTPHEAKELRFNVRSPTGPYHFMRLADGRFTMVRVDKRDKPFGVHCRDESLSIGTPTHLAAVLDGRQKTIFINGRRMSTSSWTGIMPDSWDWPSFIGFENATNWGTHDPAGTVSAYRISRTARYRNDFQPPARFEADGDTLVLYRFDEGSGEILHDASGHGRDGKIVAAKWVRADGSAIRPQSTLPNTQLAVPRTPLPDGPVGEVESIQLQNPSRGLVAAGDGRHVGIYEHTGARAKWIDLATGKSTWEQKIDDFPFPGIHATALATNGTIWVLGGDRQAKGIVYLLRTDDGTIVQTIPADDVVRSLALSGDGNLLAVGLDKGGIQTFELPGGQPVRRWLASNKIIHALAFSPTGDRLASGSEGSEEHPLKLWNVAIGEEIPFVKGAFPRTVDDLEFTPDGKLLLLGTFAEWAMVLDASTGKTVGVLKSPRRENMSPIAILPSGRHFLCSSATLFLAELPSGHIVKEFGEPGDIAHADIGPVVVTPDGRFAISAPKKENRLRVWRLPQEVWTPTASASAGASKKPLANVYDPAFQQWIKDVAALPAEQQIDAVSKKLMELNPGFDGKITGKDGKSPPQIVEGVVTDLGFVTDNVTDISPVRALMGLEILHCPGSSMGSGKLSDLSPLKGMSLTTLNCGWTQILDLSPLQGMPLTYLNCGCTHVSDLSPLNGMPLTDLWCNSTQVTSLSPLNGMKLRRLECHNCPVADLAPVQGMPINILRCDSTRVSDLSSLEQCQRLTSLNVKRTKVTAVSVATLQRALPNCKIEWNDPAKVKPLTDINSPAFQEWMKQTAALQAEQQVDAVRKKLVELNPGFDGKVTGVDGYGDPKGTPKIENGVVMSLGLTTDDVTDLSPVRALTGLSFLSCSGSVTGSGKLSDLSPLVGLPLTKLWCQKTDVFDLSPLAGMKLTVLDFCSTNVSDLSPLKGMPLDNLRCINTQVSDLSPLQGMRLKTLRCNGTQVSDLSPLHEMSTLNNLSVYNSRVTVGGVAELQKALPNCNIERNEPVKAPP